MGIADIIFLAIISTLCVLVVGSVVQHRIKVCRDFQNLRIGDKFTIQYEADSPFDEPTIFKITIIDKAIDKHGTKWIKIQYGDGSTKSERWGYFLHCWGGKVIKDERKV